MVKREQQYRDFDDPQLRELLQQTMGCVDTPAGFEERLYARALHTREPGKRASGRRRFTVRAALACSIAAVAVASGAYAVVEADFFGVAFGPKGNPDIAAHKVSEKWHNHVSTWTAPEQTWEEVDRDTAQRLLGAYVEDIDRSISMHGYTLTIEQCVIDEHGNGVATFSLENPDGLELQYLGYGRVALVNGAPTHVVMQTPNTPWDGYGIWDEYAVRDVEASTDTVLRGAMYFGPFSGEIGEGVSWLLVDDVSPRQPEQPLSDVSSVLTWSPASPVPATTLRAESGDAVDISPLALVVYHPESEDVSWDPHEVTVHYDDGSEYLVTRGGNEDPVINRVVGYEYSDRSATACVFNRLVDVNAVASVEVIDRDGRRWVYEVGEG